MLRHLSESVPGAIAVIRRDVQRALSYRAAVVATAISGVFSMVLFYYVSRLVDVEPFSTPNEYFAFVVVGLAALQIANAVLYFPLFLLSQELAAGTFERLVVSPLGAPAGLIATLAFPFASALGGTFFTLAFAAVVFDVSISWPSAALAAPASLLVGLAFAPFGLILLAGTLLFKQVAAVAGWVITLLSLLAGLYFPVALLPGWIEWASEVQPLTPAVDLLRHLLLGTDLADPGLDVLKLAIFAAALLPIALWILTRAVDAGRRKGTIIEY